MTRQSLIALVSPARFPSADARSRQTTTGPRAAVCTAVPTDRQPDSSGGRLVTWRLLVASPRNYYGAAGWPARSRDGSGRKRGRHGPGDSTTQKETHCMGAFATAGGPHRRTNEGGR